MRVIVGTAGHVDHGKTTLVKALTGIDTDRLPEEKRRGITLELGFAHVTLPSGAQVGVVDVPGHERFVKAMAAGATGIDVAILVLAADEGVMPQTREHVDICTLLGVRAGVIAITKSDLLPPLGADWPGLLTADVESLVRGTFLESAKTIFLSAKTGEGLPALLAELDRLAARLTERTSDGPLFLPIDRAFTVKGFGCVVTGTVASGRIAVGDEVQLTPSALGATRVRGIQVHGQSVDAALAGSRAAVNLHGVETNDVSRGLALTKPSQLGPARALDVELTLLASVDAPLARRTRQLVCLGTEQRECVVQLLDVDELRPGESTFAQLRFARPLAAMPGLRFILRGTNAISGRGATMGGGRVLALNPPRRRSTGTSLEALASTDAAARVTWLLDQAGYTGLTLEELLARAACAPKELQRVLDVGATKSAFVLVDKDVRRYVSGAALAALEARLVARVDAFHREQPERDGLGREELRQRLGAPLEKTFARALNSVVAAKRIEVDKEFVRIPGKGRAFDEAAKALREKALHALTSAGLQPPTITELSTRLAVTEGRVVEVLTALASEGHVVKADTLFFSSAAVAELEARLVAFLQTNDGITTQQFKELAGQSRKFLIPLAEHFDAKKVTLRVGEKRVLRKR